MSPQKFIRVHCWNMRSMQKTFFADFWMLLEGDIIRYGLDSFYSCNKCLADKNVSTNEKRFDVKQKYILTSMILSNQSTRSLRYKHRINRVLKLCGRWEICNKVNDLIKKGKSAKCNDYVSLGNDNHISTYVVHNNNGCRKVVCNFCSNAYGFEYPSAWRWKWKNLSQAMMMLYIK